MKEETVKLQTPKFFPYDIKQVTQTLGQSRLIESLRRMLMIRNFETRAESAYQMGKVGGFFHAYIGQEAIQTAVLDVFGPNNWYATSYRCHALALLLGATPNELMAELYGRATGNAKGRGGSMHFFTERLLGGFGIVSGQVPIATGAAFSLKYLNKQDQVSICFLGDGALAQGSFHESLNIAALWNLPCIYVIENNMWGMGTPIGQAVSISRLAEDKAPSYGMKGYTFDGMDFFACYAGFSHVCEEIKKNRKPILIEVLTERFRGHSISDPGLYRTKESLQTCMQRDPILLMSKVLIDLKMIDEETVKQLDKQERDVMIEAMKYADMSPAPNPLTLEEDVFAP